MRDWGFGIGKAKANATARLRACANPDPDSGGSWPDHHDVGGLGELHPQPGARDLVDAVGLGPGGLFELQAAEVDVELVARVLELRQLHEQLPVLVARADHADRGEHVGDDQDGDDEAGHGCGSAASCSATRSNALSARGLPARSEELSVGKEGVSTCRSRWSSTN